MCLGTVAKVVEVIDEGRAVVEHGGTHHPGRREDVLTMTIGDDIKPGDWVVIHSGFVLERISEARALDALTIRSTPPDPADPYATAPNPADPYAADPCVTHSHTTPGAMDAPHHKEMAP